MESYLDPLERGLMYTGISSSGFVVSIALCYLVLRIAGQGNGSRGYGRFGKFMTVIEVMDAVPESIVVSNCSVEGNMSWAFLAAISVSNLVLSMSSCFDLMATKGSRGLHRLLMAMNMVGAGMLAYSVPVQTFQVFKDQSKGKDHYWLYGIGWIAGGALAGLAFVMAINAMEEKVSSSLSGSSGSEKELLKNLEKIRDHMRCYDDGDDEETGPRHFTESDREEDDKGYEEEGQRTGKDREEEQKRRKDGQKGEEEEEQRIRTINKEEEEEREEHESDYEERRNQKFAKMMEDLDRGIAFLEGKRERHWIVEPFEETMDEEAVSSFTSPSGTSLILKALRILAIFLGLLVWSLCLTSAFVMLFVWLKKDHGSVVFYGDSLAEGISAGAFLGSLSGTIIPRLMQDAYGSEWDLLRTKICSMVCFMVGISISVALDMLESFR